jgi:archaellum component FlaG (FlaF/FlaG flagellin family)
MGQTYVYNTGKAEVADEEVEVTFGVFIDGTLNNKANTKLRYKVEGKTDPLLEKGDSTTSTQLPNK